MKGCGHEGCHQTAFAPNDFCFYHSKRASELIGPLDEYLTDTELNASMDGRLHQDGRRLDHYVTLEDM